MSMNAIVPLNITALRVSANDASGITSPFFKGRTALFENMPWNNPSQPPPANPVASTGDTIVQTLDSTSGPADPLRPGVHVHWQLPDYFRRGVQQPGGGKVVFPHVPNRWLVIRYLSVYNSATSTYGPVQSSSFIVESDYLAGAPLPDPWLSNVYRSAVSVPLPVNAPFQTQPYMYMGRVLPYASWDPSSESASDFLPSYVDEDNQPCYLTSIGFVGPGFSAFYPECLSVFGFWDHFGDNQTVYPELGNQTLNAAINNNSQVQFKVSYQVIGWINETASDPLATVAADVIAQYNHYVGQCHAQRVPVLRTPATFFLSIAEKSFKWTFQGADITYTLNADQTVATLNVPGATLCAGVIQEVVWNNLASPGTTYFLNDPSVPASQQPYAIWNDTVRVAIGNTTQEALAALLKQEMGNNDNSPNVLTNYEYLLDALQVGLLNDLEGQANKIINLDESLHAKAFYQSSGGLVWMVQKQASDPNAPPVPGQEITLPLSLAEQLSLLNSAQKTYDQGRAALSVLRKQLFMDWLRWVKIFVSGVQDQYVDFGQLTGFLATGGGSGELNSVTEAGTATGILLYQLDPVSKKITGLQSAAGPGSSAANVWTQFQTVTQALQAFPNWTMEAVPAPAFQLPTDPVLLMEGDRMEPAKRNGSENKIAARVSPELLSSLAIQYSGSNFTVVAASISGLPSISATVPYQRDVQALVGEGALLIPSLAPQVAVALQAQGGTNNPAVTNLSGFIASLQSAQGGLSPLAGGPGSGLFAAIRVQNYAPAANPSQVVAAPLAITFSFTNPAANGWAPDAVSWSAQTALPEFSAVRNDPFLPVFLLWKIQLWPLQWRNGKNYTADNLSAFFELNSDAVDYQYQMPSSGPVPFTASNFAPYTGTVVLSSKSAYSLQGQIQNYAQNYPQDPADPTLNTIQTFYGQRKILSQALSGFNVEQILKTYLPQIAVQDTHYPARRDPTTRAISAAARATPNDDWYDFSFNGEAPIATVPLAEINFGPLRSGFLQVDSLTIVDVFGQQMTLGTVPLNPVNNTLQTIAALSLQPRSGDTANQDKIFLPPRLLVPTRLWFRWLSALHDNNLSGDFVEMNSHPATSPVCGWVLPNHLDNSLFFYDASGAAVGSFGIEHGVVTYRTRAGNQLNPASDLATDIGPQAGPPTVNPHLATFMWYINGRTAGFLSDLMVAIQNSDAFINPANYSQDANLAVFIGRPLAITRAVLSMETSGGLLPLSQADYSSGDPFPQDVANDRYAYGMRQPFSSANLGGVQFPVRLGELANLDDGLVGYLIESAGSSPGGNPYDTLYSAAAAAGGANGVEQPTPNTIQLTLNTAPLVLTMLVDPRADVHATTGVLPVSQLEIPPDQYSQAMSNLAMTFFTNPVLCGYPAAGDPAQGLVIPLPHESGYSWQWITPGAPGSAMPDPITLKAEAATDFATYSYSPQMLLEGWLKLFPTPPAPPSEEK